MYPDYSTTSIFLAILFMFTHRTVSQDYYDSDDLSHQSSESSKITFESDAVPYVTNNANTDNELRKKLCPPNLASDLDRFYQRTSECYRTDKQGPCGENMLFYGQPNNTVYGSCDCAHKNYNRPLIYHKASDQCYFIFKQAYCRPGEWLTISRSDGLPACEPNLCFPKVQHTLNRNEEFVQFEGKCVKLNSKCGQEKVITFLGGSILPKCSLDFQITSPYALGVPTLKCSPGSVMSFTGMCLRNWVW